VPSGMYILGCNNTPKVAQTSFPSVDFFTSLILGVIMQTMDDKLNLSSFKFFNTSRKVFCSVCL
jgi:hypothetical protein